MKGLSEGRQHRPIPTEEQAVEDPVSVLAEMKDHLRAERDQYFICGGARFTIARAVDCFALIVVQFGNEFEFALLGLARFRQPRDPSAKALCYVEMQILMSIRPSEGSFKLQALLTRFMGSSTRIAR